MVAASMAETRTWHGLRQVMVKVKVFFKEAFGYCGAAKRQPFAAFGRYILLRNANFHRLPVTAQIFVVDLY